MYADSSGRIERPGLVSGSDSWRILGAVRVNNFGHVVERFTLADLLERADSIPWRFRNGKQRTHVVDYDHGSRRVWMSPRHDVRVMAGLPDEEEDERPDRPCDPSCDRRAHPMAWCGCSRSTEAQS